VSSGAPPSTPPLARDGQQQEDENQQNQRDANTMTSPASSTASSPGHADSFEEAVARLLRNAELHRDAVTKSEFFNISYSLFVLAFVSFRCFIFVLTHALEKKKKKKKIVLFCVCARR
jgi:hypothetical protein